MADLSLTGEQELLRSTARDFIQRECPISRVREIDESNEAFSRGLWEMTAQLGWTGLLLPDAHGGQGGSLTDAAVLFEEIGRGLLPGPYLSSGVFAAQLIASAGSSELKEDLLPAIASGRRIATVALTEAGYGWTGEHVRCDLTPRGGSFVLNGVKQFVPDAGSADFLIVAARGGDGVALCLVDAGAAGVERNRMRGFVGEALYEVLFRDVAVPHERVIGEIGAGWDTLEPALETSTALLCAFMAGACRRVYDMSITYAQRRVQFGQPIARFQRVQDRLIEMVNAADAAWLTAYEAVWKIENGKADVRAAVSLAKVVASDGFYQSCEHAHHVHGGVGSDKAYGLYLYTMASRSLYHYLGSPAHHRARLAEELGLG